MLGYNPSEMEPINREPSPDERTSIQMVEALLANSDRKLTDHQVEQCFPGARYIKDHRENYPHLTDNDWEFIDSIITRQYLKQAPTPKIEK